MAGTYSYRIESRDLDRTRRARLCAMGEMCLEAAGDDADMLGFGIGDLNSGAAGAGVEASWVLSRVAIEMRRLPEKGETVDIYTWVSDYGRLFTTRNMTLAVGGGGDSNSGGGGSGVGESGRPSEEIGACVTQWAMIDLATRRPMDLSALSNKSTSLVDREPPVEKPRKVPLAEYSVERSYEVVYSDIDFNGHVNSMKYLEWMVDLLPRGEAESFGVRGVRIDLNYLHEALSGEVLTIFGGEGPGGAQLYDIKNGDGTSICRGAITPLT